jgi:hypothetical protein
VALALTAPLRLSAAVFCVGSATQLQDALSSAASNGQDDLIKIRAGYYALGEPFEYLATEPNNLFLIGGYDVGCNVADAAAATTFDGQDGSGLLLLDAEGPADASTTIALVNLTWQNGIDYAFFTSQFAPVLVSLTGAKLLIERNQFRGNSSTETACSILLESSTSVTVSNSLFTGNAASAAGASPVCANASDPGATYAGYFHSNTVTGNSGPDQLIAYSGVKLGGAHTWSVANNILYDNSSVDLGVNAPAELRNNDIGVKYVAMGVSATSSGDVSVDPGFVSGSNFHLHSDSAIVNAGPASVPGGLGLDDLEGNPRIVGKGVDIGAYENQDAIFADDFQ